MAGALGNSLNSHWYVCAVCIDYFIFVCFPVSVWLVCNPQHLPAGEQGAWTSQGVHNKQSLLLYFTSLADES